MIAAATSHSNSRRQPRAGPARKGVGLVVADVADRLVQRAPAACLRWCSSTTRRRAAPSTAARSTDCCATQSHPSESHNVGLRIAAVAHELQVLAVGHQSRRQPEWLRDTHCAAGLRCRTRSRRPRSRWRTHLPQSSATARLRRRLPATAASALGAAIRRPKRIRPQAVLHIGDDQFLMLLLVIDAERRPGRAPLAEARSSSRWTMASST